MIKGHGADSYLYKKITADFSSNVFPGMPCKTLSEYLKKNIDEVADYPPPHPFELAEKLEKKHNLKKGSVILTNGAAEAFYMIAHAFYAEISGIFIPTFAEYEDACKINNHKLSFLRNCHPVNTEFPGKLIWLCNPNNPDGRIYLKEEILNFAMTHPEKILIVDESYMEMCLKDESVIPGVNDFENLIVIRSFTKTYGIPGLRLGYICTNSKLAKHLSKFLIPWSVNSLAMKAGLFIVENEKEIKPDIDKLIKYSKDLQNQINDINDLKVIDSECNFFLVRLGKYNADKLKSILAENYGLLIRDASNFRGLDEKYIRIAAQKPGENNLLIKALKEIYE